MSLFSKVGAGLLAVLLALAVLLPPNAGAQATIATGNIQGTISDASGAVISGAKITLLNRATAQQQTFTTTGAGTFNTGAIIPGEYTLRISQPGFKTVEVPLTVQVGVTTPANIRMEVGAEGEVVEVAANAVTVNTEQATLQGVLTTEQIDQLPVNGRNFLEIAQLEPGVQIQDASNFDPTKGGFTGISVGSRSGRTTRIEVDGLDISDENVGTSITNLSPSAIQEFSVSQSNLDLSTELTSSGAVNVVTRSGSNDFHGEAFYLFRDNAIAADFTGGLDLPYQRNQFGGRFGGPIVKDKFFIFANVERTKQDLLSPITPGAPFETFNSGAPSPFREITSLLKADFNLPGGGRAFYRLSYLNNDGISNVVPAYTFFLNTNNTPSHAWGVDFSKGNTTHSVRLGYTKFSNHISDDPGSRVFDLVPQAEIRIGTFRSGPNILAPQATFQSNLQGKYDGSWVRGKHTLRYGITYNRILGGGFANFFGLAPSLRSSTAASRQAFASDSCDPDTVLDGFTDAGDGLQPCFPGGISDPRNYPITQAILGNGQGFFTETSEFGLPGGGQFDNRVQFYVADTWKVLPNLTFNYGVRYLRDTGRTNSDLGQLTCDQIDLANFSPAPTTCTDRILDMFGAGLGRRVRQDNNNWGGSIGLAWDPWNQGKTVIRAGAGVYYENAIFNNVLFSRPLMLERGLFNAVAITCGAFGGSVGFPTGPVTTTPGGFDIATEVCGRAVGGGVLSGGTISGTNTVAGELAALQAQWQAAVAAAGAAANPSFVGNTLSPTSDFGNLLHPDYRTPYSIQMNVGVQHELWRGLVVSADFVRNVTIGYLLFLDTNHVGDSRFLNTTAANNAIAATLADFGVATIDQAIAAGATITDFANHGLDSGSSYLAGESPLLFGLSPDLSAAFGGMNTEVGRNDMLHPVGRSNYTALQVKATGRKSDVAWFRNTNFTASYALSRFNSMAPDQDFINPALSYRNLRFMGPAAFDRTHQFSFGSVLEFKGMPLRLSMISHIKSPLAQSYFMLNPADTRPGEIFFTDLDGDGTVADPIGGSNIGESRFTDVQTAINRHNGSFAGTLSPAALALLDAGLFTADQLASLGAVIDTLPDAPTNQVALDWLTTFDLKVAVPIQLGERFTLEAQAGFYNLFNFANFDRDTTNLLNGFLDGSVGSLNGTPVSQRNVTRAFQSTGVFSLGSPRQMEFGLRLTF